MENTEASRRIIEYNNLFFEVDKDLDGVYICKKLMKNLKPRPMKHNEYAIPKQYVKREFFVLN